MEIACLVNKTYPEGAIQTMGDQPLKSGDIIQARVN